VNTAEFERRIERLDLQLFNAVKTQAREGDKQSWLALQRAIRRSNASYTYLEIGSYLGGSLQPHLLDPKCTKIFSIDKRSFEAPDDRALSNKRIFEGPDDRAHLDCVYQYENNDTERMLQNLRAVDPNQITKIKCFDSDSRGVDPTLIEQRPDICFIDGEHTSDAVVSDFEFCLKVCASNAAICFHDDNIIYPALSDIEHTLRTRNIPFAALKLLDTTYLIALRDSPVCQDYSIRNLATDGRRYVRQRKLARLVKRHLPRSALSIVRPISGRLVRLF
jgi:hypothetical protein